MFTTFLSIQWKKYLKQKYNKNKETMQNKQKR